MSFILNIETATEVCSIALSKGEEILSLKEAPGPNDHAKIITLLMEKCLNNAGIALREIDAVAISTGPGSYTSLRVGSATAKGICYALNKPLIAIDTLQALALATLKTEQLEGYYCPMIDARRMEVYCGIFDSENKLIVGQAPKVIDENAFQEYFSAGKRIVFSGNGAEKCRKVIHSELAVFSKIVCSAAHLVPLSFEAFKKKNFTDTAYFTPTYLKAPNITVPGKKTGLI